MPKKHIIIGYPWSEILSILFCFSFAGIAFWAYDFKHPIFWITILFFGLGGIALMIKTFFSNREYVSRHSNRAVLLKSQNKSDFLNSLGSFTYDNDGFSIRNRQDEDYIAWNDIVKMVGYKIDLISYDEIRLAIFLENEDSYELGEEMPGWFQFLERSKTQFNSIDKLWELKISIPPFKRNEIIIYQKEIVKTP